MTAEEIQQIFFLECEESLAAAEQGLAACKEARQDDDTINGVFRAVHSIKGGAGAFGFIALQAYTHTFETLLSDVREGAVALEPLVNLLLRALDVLADHVLAARGEGDTPDDVALLAELTAAMAANAGGAAPAPAAPAAAEPAPAAVDYGDPSEGPQADFDSTLDDILSGFDLGPPPAAEGPAEAPRWQLQLRPHSGAMRNGSEPLVLLRELLELGGTLAKCDHSAVPTLDAYDPAVGYLGWKLQMPADVTEDMVRDVFDFVGDGCGLAFGDDAAMPAVQAGAPAPRAVAAEPAPPPPPPASPPPLVAVAPVTAPPAEPLAPAARAESPAAAAAATAPAAGQSIRIDLAKLDKLIDTVGELVIAQAMLAQRLTDSAAGQGSGSTSGAVSGGEELAMLESLTRDIQESAMAIRAQPIGSVFSRVPRILRELAQSTGKHVRLEVSGESTELDKTVIERLGEPLTHLIRNAVDHGIESAEERLAAGKSAEGTLTLLAEQRSGRILIRIGDDGKGIDRNRVLAKAIEKGIVSADAQLSREEIDNLIFAPGFSTAANITSVSGRGVGMDVVRQHVKDLGGRVTIESHEGKGTTFTLTLPLTLAISDGMIVTVGDQALVVPLAHVIESLKPSSNDLKGVGAGQSVLNVRGRFLPVLDVERVLGGPARTRPPEDGVLIVVDTEAAGRAALLVDDICDQRQFVIKSLDTHYRAVDGVAGATILGDGRVALILDVDGLVADAVASGSLSGVGGGGEWLAA